jgi:cobalamin biosynthesis Mg chelatase CobN
LVAALAPAAAAGAVATSPTGGPLYVEIHNEFLTRGAITVCAHTEQDLLLAQSEAPPGLSTQQPAFYQALQSAIAERPHLTCTGTSTVQATGTAPGAATAPAATTPTTPATATATVPATTAPPATTTPGAAVGVVKHTSSGKSSGISSQVLWALAAVLVLIALAAIWFLLVSLRAEPPRWLLNWRHALSEAGYRIGGTLADFGDWLRLGR